MTASVTPRVLARSSSTGVLLLLLSASPGARGQIMEIPLRIPPPPKYINSIGWAEYDWPSRFDKAQHLAETGHPADALTNYVWCYENGGLPMIGEHQARLYSLFSKVVELGRAYPPAAQQLRTWQSENADLIRKRTRSIDKIYCLIVINSVLGEDAATIKLYDSLPRGDFSRQLMGKEILPKLVDCGRYADALGAYPPALLHRRLQSTAAHPESSSPRLRSFDIELGAATAQAMVGVGDFHEARIIVDDVLAIDRSPGTIGILSARFARMGKSAWIAAEANRLAAQNSKDPAGKKN